MQWEKWLLGWLGEGDKWEGEAELLVNMIHINGGYQVSHGLQLNPQYQKLVKISNHVCHLLCSLKSTKVVT